MWPVSLFKILNIDLKNIPYVTIFVKLKCYYLPFKKICRKLLWYLLIHTDCLRLITWKIMILCLNQNPSSICYWIFHTDSFLLWYLSQPLVINQHLSIVLILLLTFLALLPMLIPVLKENEVGQIHLTRYINFESFRVNLVWLAFFVSKRLSNSFCMFIILIHAQVTLKFISCL